MQLVQQPVNEGAVTGISQYPVSFYVLRYFSEALHSLQMLCIQFICGISGRDVGVTDTRDWLRPVTKWTWLPMWCDAQFICQTNYTQMPHSWSCFASQNFCSCLFYLCKIQCTAAFPTAVKGFESCGGTKYIDKIMQLFPTKVIQLQRQTFIDFLAPVEGLQAVESIWRATYVTHLSYLTEWMYIVG